MIYKVAKCYTCGALMEDKTGKFRGLCKKCGHDMSLLPNWYVRRYGVKKVVGPRRADAEAEEAAIVAAHAEGRSFINRVHSLVWSKARERFENHVAQHNKPRTVEFYKNRLDALEQYFKPNQQIDKITLLDIDDYVQSRQGQVSDVTINRDISALRRFLNFAQQRRMISHNPASGYRMFAEQERSRILSKDEEELLLAECAAPGRPKHLLPIVLCALLAGLRKNDIYRLKRSELDFEAGLIVKETIGKKRKGHERGVCIPLNTNLATALRLWLLRSGRATEWVFPSPSDPTKPMCPTAKVGFESVVKKLKLKDLTFHDLRRTYATRFAEGGGDMKALQTIMGHTSIEITSKFYTHVSTDYLKRQSDKAFANP